MVHLTTPHMFNIYKKILLMEKSLLTMMDFQEKKNSERQHYKNVSYLII